MAVTILYQDKEILILGYDTGKVETFELDNPIYCSAYIRDYRIPVVKEQKYPSMEYDFLDYEEIRLQRYRVKDKNILCGFGKILKKWVVGK